MTRLKGSSWSLAWYIPRWSALDTSLPTWRARAVRYVLIYLALVTALVSVRALTRDVRPALKAAQAREAALTTQSADLSVQLQTLESRRRLLDWAAQNGMRRLTDVPRETATFQPVPAAPVAAPPARTVEVKTLWK
ncbi:hypothetical protein [Deinococcus arboris]|uniref:hypothetical protein n=1 Tax=Deinococcus arboris TaxID=2682977 RepID=UPI0034E1B319